MGNSYSDPGLLLFTFNDVHAPLRRDTYYFANLCNGGDHTKIVGRSQSASIEVEYVTVLGVEVYEQQSPIFDPRLARLSGLLRIPISRLKKSHPDGFFRQWFSLDATADPRITQTDRLILGQNFEAALRDATRDVYSPKICLTLCATSYTDEAKYDPMSVFTEQALVAQDIGPTTRALVASHKQQAQYIEALHEELRKQFMPVYRPLRVGETEEEKDKKIHQQRYVNGKQTSPIPPRS